MRAFTFVAAAAAGLAAALEAPAQLPQFPSSFTVSGTISLPYANLTETFTTWVDGVAVNQRIEYYAGLDTYIMNNASAAQWQVNPEGYAYNCFITPGPVSISTFLPDTTNFTYIGPWSMPNGVTAWHYQMVQANYGRLDTYDMYVSSDGSFTPLQLSFLGYDILLGSHYDQYSFVYEYFSTLPIDPSRFAEPSGPYTCGPFPGPGAEGQSGPVKSDPLALPNELIPQPAWAARTQPGAGDAPAGPAHKNDKAWRAFVSSYGRSFPTEAEEARRYALFTSNRRLVEQGNRRAHARGSSLRLGLNNFADATREEMAPRYGRRADGSSNGSRAGKAGRSNGAHAVHTASVPKSALPASVDWSLKGAVSPVPDQAICGSCWAHGATGTLEGQLFLATGTMTVLSKQELMDCSWGQGNNACDGGEDWRGYQWIMANGGISSIAAYGPYLAQDGFCHANASGLAKALTVTSYVNVTSGDETALMDALANVGPISISIDAAVPSFSFYSSGVYDDPACANGMDDLDHTVLATGYGTDPVSGDYWIVRNSWSTHWGAAGFIKIARQGNICGVATDPTYANIQVLA